MTKFSFDKQTIKQLLDSFVITKAELDRQFKLAYDNDSDLATLEKLSQIKREICEIEIRVSKLFNVV